jgi:hypothetical protein
MRRSLSLWIILLLFSLLHATQAFAQYLYLDTNGDGRNTSEDHLKAVGSTNVAVYLDTNHDRDGSLQTCNSHSTGTKSSTDLGLLSYEFILHVIDGTGSVTWGAFVDSLGFSPLENDRFNTTDYWTSQGASEGLPPGRYKLGQLEVTALSGAPALQIEQRSSLDPALFTGFGTQCEGSSFPNSYLLGTDWFDADGLSVGDPVGPQAPRIRVSGKGLMFLAGNSIPGPWILEMPTAGHLVVNGLSLPTPAQRAPDRSPDQLAIDDFLTRTDAFVDSLGRSTLSIEDQTERLRLFCTQNNVGATAEAHDGAVDVTLRNRTRISYSLRPQVIQVPSGKRVTSAEHAISRLREIGWYLESGAIVFVVDQATQVVVPRVEVRTALAAMEKIRAGLTLTPAEDRVLPLRVRGQIRTPTSLDVPKGDNR